MMRIGFVGGGKMAQALAKGFIAAGLTKADKLMASCIPEDTQSIQAFEGMGSLATHDNNLVVQNSEVVILGVKPSVVPLVLSGIRDNVTSNHLILSIAMGVSVGDIEQALPKGSRVVRVMPNTPSIILSGAAVFVQGSAAKPEDAQTTQKLLQAVGTCEQVPEHFMDPITALSGSGPAYVYLMIESLADGGVKMGLPRDLAYRLAAQTVVGAGLMVRDTNIHPGQLKDDVTSPAGSTAAGLHFLEQNGLRAAVIGAIEEATKKCRQISSKSPDSS